MRQAYDYWQDQPVSSPPFATTPTPHITVSATYNVFVSQILHFTLRVINTREHLFVQMNTTSQFFIKEYALYIVSNRWQHRPFQPATISQQSATYISQQTGGRFMPNTLEVSQKGVNHADKDTPNSIVINYKADKKQRMKITHCISY